VAVVWPDRIAVGPDNGLFTYLLLTDTPWSAYELTETIHQLRPRSATFHGRDIFAPVAAHLAAGIDPSRLGPPVDELLRFSLPKLECDEQGILTGEIIHIDRFGNAISSIGQLLLEEVDICFDPWLPNCTPARYPQPAPTVRAPGRASLPLHRTFSDVPTGQPVAYIGSSGLIEIAVHGASAEQELGLSKGQRIQLEWRE
jgi:S-adenosylmethionine hydrolase